MSRKDLKAYLPGTALFLLLFCLISAHYFLWVFLVEPLPDHDGLFQYYYPVLNYLRSSMVLGNDWVFLKNVFFDPQYSQGSALIAWFYAACGGAKLIINNPYLLNVFCILAICCFAFFFRGSFKERFVIGLIFGFFPLLQICIKQFSLFGPTVIFSFLALLFFRSWLVYRKLSFLSGFVLCFWFAAAMKHLGLLLLLNFIFVYLFWALINRRWDSRVMGAAIISFMGALPFYHLPGLQEYFHGSLAHNSFFAAHPVTGGVLFAFIVLFLLFLPLSVAYYLRSMKKKRRLIPKVFRGGVVFLFSLLLSVLIVIGDFLSAQSIIATGYIGFLFLICKYQFRGARGFIYLYSLLSLILMLALYRTGVGHISYVVFLPLLLMVIQTISENGSFSFRILFLLLILLCTNFFPGFNTLDKSFGRYGRRVYILFFHSPHQNPLGWHNYGFGALRREVINKLSEYSFPKAPLFLVENFGPFTSGQFAYRKNVLYSFSPMMFLEWAKDGQLYPELHRRYMQEGENLFASLFADGDIPVLLYSENMPLCERDEQPFSLEELSVESDFNLGTVPDDLYVFAFNQELLDYLNRTDLLKSGYNCFEMPAGRIFANLCLDKRLERSDTGKVKDYGAEYLSDIMRIRDPE